MRFIKSVNLKRVSYDLYKGEGIVLFIYPKKIIVRFTKDIKAETTEKAIFLANKRISDFIKSFNIEGIKIGSEPKQLSRHYAIVGIGLAKQKVKEGKKIIVLSDDGKVRHRIDTSIGKPELDNEDIKTNEADTNAWQRFAPKIDEGWDLRMEKYMEQISSRHFDSFDQFREIKDILRLMMERLQR